MATPAWKTSDIALNSGQLWGGLALPGAGLRVTILTDGTPDAAANPSGYHYGATKSGSKVMVKSSFTKQYVDEFRAPIATNLDTIEMGISAELVGVTSSELLERLLPGVGTYSTTALSHKQVTIGSKAIAYECIALIYQLIDAPTKYGVFNIYSALNDTGVEWAVARKELGFTPVSFVGYELTTRAAADTLGNVWKQIA